MLPLAETELSAPVTGIKTPGWVGGGGRVGILGVAEGVIPGTCGVFVTVGGSGVFDGVSVNPSNGLELATCVVGNSRTHPTITRHKAIRAVWFLVMDNLLKNIFTILLLTTI